MVLLVYVDDVLIACNDKTKIDKFKVMLDDKFQLKDLGDLKYFLGLEVARSDKGIVFVKESTHLRFLMMLVWLDVSQLRHLWNKISN